MLGGDWSIKVQRVTIRAACRVYSLISLSVSSSRGVLGSSSTVGSGFRVYADKATDVTKNLFLSICSYPRPQASPLTPQTSPLLTPPHPSSPLLTPPHPSSPLLTPPHPSSPLLTPPYPSSPLLTRPHPSSPHLTPPHQF